MIFKYLIIACILFLSLNNIMAGGLRKNIQSRSTALIVKAIDLLIKPLYPMPKLQQVKHYFELKTIANYAPPRLAKKLKETVELNYDEEYHKKYVAEHLLVRERVAKKIAEKLGESEQKLNVQSCLSEGALTRYCATKKDIGTKIRSESYPGIWFTAPGKEPFQLEDNELTPAQAKIVTSLKKCMPLFDIESIIIDTSFYDKTPMEMDIYARKIPILSYNEDSVLSYPDGVLDPIIAHECAHAQFRHFVRYFNQYSNFPEGLHILQYYKEKEANAHSILIFSSEYEAYAWQFLETALKTMPKATKYFDDNDPIKGCPNDDVHPSWLHDYIQAFKIRNLLEAEQRWFSCEEANERYGSVYYERAWQKWATEQTELTK